MFSNLHLNPVRFPKPLESASDHKPIVVNTSLLVQCKRPKVNPCSSKFGKCWEELRHCADQKECWRKLLNSKLSLPSKIRSIGLKKEYWDLDLSDYLAQYFDNYRSSVEDLAGSLFSNTDRGSWFIRLKNLTGYDKFDKRDGSIASCCIINNKICTGSWFNRQVKSWYEGISLKGPTLLPSSFPNIPIDWSQLRDLLARTSRYSKAYSVDCIDSMPFKIVKLVEECCAENICSEHRIWIDRLLFIFSKEFWSLQ